MGSIIVRGGRASPRFYVKYREADGQQRMRFGGDNRGEAKAFLGDIEARVRRGLPGVPEVAPAQMVGKLLTEWSEALTNRNAQDDRCRVKRHLQPAWGSKTVKDITLPAVMKWIDAQRKKGSIGEPTIRHNLNTLSRFMGWLIERGHAEINPVRQIPQGKRPKASPKKHDAPWINDDTIVNKLIGALSPPFSLMFYAGNRSGLRPGEAAGLRMSDLGFLDEGTIRVRYSYSGPLKEDKDSSGKTKFVPAATDAKAMLSAWMKKRHAEGAKVEDLLFPSANGKPYRKEQIEDEWDRVAPAIVGKHATGKITRHGRPIDRAKPALTFYQATRHSFTSRNLANGVSLDEVSSALGHSSPVVTRRYYDHFVRKTFSSQIRKAITTTKDQPEA